MKTSLLLAASIMITSCQSLSRRPTTDLQHLVDELGQVDPSQHALAAQSPVLDCHVHTFNARYLPLRGILLGKRDAAPPWSWLLSDQCATEIAAWMVRRTAPVPGAPMPDPVTAGDPTNDRPRSLFCAIVVSVLEKAEANGCWDRSKSLEARENQVRKTVRQMTLAERTAVRTAARMMGLEENLVSRSQKSNLEASLRFLWILTLSDSEILDLYQLDHNKNIAYGPISFITHTMDLAPVYNQPPDPHGVIDFSKVQVPRTAALTRPGDHWFVAYNPYRDSWEGGRPGEALRVVQEAIKKHGARGVKIYPPSGYRPAANQVKRRPRALASPAPGRQWDARYPERESAAINERLDRQLKELLVWCLAEDVPVFTHCGHGEFEARQGYGEHHSHPAFWHAFLKEHPGPGNTPCPLRLCLGHGGGADFWFGEGHHPEWGREVHIMCTTFPNVYCEITANAELTDPALQAAFAAHLIQLIKNPPPAARYPLEKKILFGTDWPLPDPARPGCVLQAAQQVFLLRDLRGHYHDYFHLNARRYLGAP